MTIRQTQVSPSEIKRCYICDGTNFSPVVDLGTTPLADDFLTEDRLAEPETYYPLKVVVCYVCGLVQLTHTVSRTKLYPADYPYLSSTTETGRQHYYDMASSIVDRFNLTGLAIDIGSNVGVLLEGFQKKGMGVLGIEPVGPIAQRATLAGIPTISQFFDTNLAHDITQCFERASVITGTNVVAHIAHLRGLAEGIHTLLAPGGVFVFEAPYLINLIEGMAYDTIYHEHLSYLSINPVQYLLRNYGLEVFDVEPQSSSGALRADFGAALDAAHVPAVVQCPGCLASPDGRRRRRQGARRRGRGRHE